MNEPESTGAAAAAEMDTVFEKMGKINLVMLLLLRRAVGNFFLRPAGRFVYVGFKVAIILEDGVTRGGSDSRQVMGKSAGSAFFFWFFGVFTGGRPAVNKSCHFMLMIFAREI